MNLWCATPLDSARIKFYTFIYNMCSVPACHFMLQMLVQVVLTTRAIAEFDGSCMCF